MMSAIARDSRGVYSFFNHPQLRGIGGPNRAALFPRPPDLRVPLKLIDDRRGRAVFNLPRQLVYCGTAAELRR